MAVDVETVLRGPQAYDVARKSMDLMERHPNPVAPNQYLADVICGIRLLCHDCEA